MTTTRFAAIQLCSTASVADNNAQIEDLVRQAADQGASVISLPEAANILLRDNMQYPATCVPEARDTTLALCQKLARERGIWLHDGSLLVLCDDGKRVWNRTHLISPLGEVVARYDKLHTFDVKLGGAGDFQESLAVRPGETGPVVAQLGENGLNLGFSICYDLRFAYLFRALAQANANVLMIPASFSPVTGPLHWETLLKARAIETGSYVVAAAQCGTRDGVKTFGHTMIVSPFGEVITALGDEPGFVLADIDPAVVETTRGRLPCLMQDREIGPVTTLKPGAGNS
ncbi:carbon-nitrogen hydrolase family protein [Thalassospira sp. TSL5-1]|uniref:carbon-nitrogen hydrolase family protein n=1 Tax=Thalassospira sp. TSL5-1 TaxID=1544451 RepID=UPI00093A280D|nr:carbon-nitrogen hydrolase family protein [Thalassospira sp. TSL5-1]OKH88133.1 hydrolase [Thalassospira sp. TSL5-1]